MHNEIERLILKLRKEVHRDLQKGKPIRPRAYFFVVGKEEPLSEIIVPGIEYFLQSAFLKTQLKGYLQHKWLEYKQRRGYYLVAVLVMSDAYFVQRDTAGLSKAEGYEKYKNVQASREPDRMEVIWFTAYTATEQHSRIFPYQREKAHIQWGEPLPEGGELFGGKFKDLFPERV